MSGPALVTRQGLERISQGWTQVSKGVDSSVMGREHGDLGLIPTPRKQNKHPRACKWFRWGQSMTWGVLGCPGVSWGILGCPWVFPKLKTWFPAQLLLRVVAPLGGGT